MANGRAFAFAFVISFVFALFSVKNVPMAMADC